MHSAARRLAAVAASSALAGHPPAAGLWSGTAALGAAWASIGRSAAGLHTAPASSSTDIKAVMAEKVPIQQVRLSRARGRASIVVQGLGHESGDGPGSPPWHFFLGSQWLRAARERGGCASGQDRYLPPRPRPAPPVDTPPAGARDGRACEREPWWGGAPRLAGCRLRPLLSR
jgi:hypothetical protein